VEESGRITDLPRTPLFHLRSKRASGQLFLDKTTEAFIQSIYNCRIYTDGRFLIKSSYLGYARQSIKFHSYWVHSVRHFPSRATRKEIIQPNYYTCNEKLREEEDIWIAISMSFTSSKLCLNSDVNYYYHMYFHFSPRRVQM
jgi:hypothetical protein